MPRPSGVRQVKGLAPQVVDRRDAGPGEIEGGGLHGET